MAKHDTASTKSSIKSSTHTSTRSSRYTIVSSSSSAVSEGAKKIAKGVQKAVNSGAKKIKKAFAKTKKLTSRPLKKTKLDKSSDDLPELEDAVSDDGDHAADSDEEPAKETDEQELQRLQAGWGASIYSFFDQKVTVGYEDGRKFHFFKCAHKRCKGGVRRFQDKKDRCSTGNLTGHAKGCFGEAAVDAARKKQKQATKDGSIWSMFAKLGQRPKTHSNRALTPQETRVKIIRWVTESTRPANIVADPGFDALMKIGRPTTVIPSPRQVARDIHAAFVICRSRISELLQNYRGALSFATDAWTSPNHRAFVAWTVHLEHEGHPFSFLLDIVEVPESHTGETLAREFHKTLLSFGIANKMLAWVRDNASNNDTQNEALAVHENCFESVNRVRCFNHTLNLVVKAILKPFSNEKEDDDSKLQPINNDDVVEEDECADPDDCYSTEDDDDESSDAMEEEVPDEVLAKDIEKAKFALSKVRKAAFAIVHSTTIILPAWRRACKARGLGERLIPRDVRTRWNSTYDMLEVAVKYRKAFDDITSDKSLKLRGFELDETEWIVLEDLSRVLAAYKEATLRFSREGTATIAHVLPIMDKLDRLKTDRVKTGPNTTRPVHPAVVAALERGKTLMNKYYELTDLSNIYHIAMVLHPGLKLKYFVQQKWPKAWIDNAKDITQEEFQRYLDCAEERRKAAKSNEENDISSVDGSVEADFMDISLGNAGKLNELDEYLALPVERVSDPSEWWNKHKDQYPCLHRMALDFLSIPATSTAVERIFSKGRQLLHFTRSRLSAASVRAYMCIGDWSRKDLVVEEDLLEVVSPKRKRSESTEKLEGENGEEVEA